MFEQKIATFLQLWIVLLPLWYGNCSNDINERPPGKQWEVPYLP